MFDGFMQETRRYREKVRHVSGGMLDRVKDSDSRGNPTSSRTTFSLFDDSNKSKSHKMSKSSTKISSKWSIDWNEYDFIRSEFNRRYSKAINVKSSDPSITSSLERLSYYFKASADKSNYGQDNLVKFCRLSPKSLADTLTLDLNWISKMEYRPLMTFCTGCKYAGDWNAFGMTGEGLYKFPHGVIYDGTFNVNGLFHGMGTLIYPNGQRVQGIWSNGELTTSTCGTNLREDEELYFFSLSDRRYDYEYEKGFGVTGKEYLTNQQPTPELPEDCYDVVEGIYCPKHGCILPHSLDNKLPEDNLYNDVRYAHLNEDKDQEQPAIIADLKSDLEDMRNIGKDHILEIPTEKKAEWIKQYCRSNPGYPVGYNPAFYEFFTAGTRAELNVIEQTEETHLGYAQNYPGFESDTFTPDETDKTPVSFIHRINKDYKDKRKKTVDSINTIRVKKKSNASKKSFSVWNKMEDNVSIITFDKELMWLVNLRRSAVPSLIKSLEVKEPKKDQFRKTDDTVNEESRDRTSFQKPERRAQKIVDQIINADLTSINIENVESRLDSEKNRISDYVTAALKKHTKDRSTSTTTEKEMEKKINVQETKKASYKKLEEAKTDLIERLSSKMKLNILEKSSMHDKHSIVGTIKEKYLSNDDPKKMINLKKELESLDNRSLKKTNIDVTDIYKTPEKYSSKSKKPDDHSIRKSVTVTDKVVHSSKDINTNQRVGDTSKLQKKGIPIAKKESKAEKIQIHSDINYHSNAMEIAEAIYKFVN